MIHGLLLSGLTFCSLMGFTVTGILVTTLIVMALEPLDNNAVKELRFGRKEFFSGIIMCLLSFGLAVLMKVNPAIVDTLIGTLICDGMFLMFSFSGVYVMCLGVDTIRVARKRTGGDI